MDVYLTKYFEKAKDQKAAAEKVWELLKKGGMEYQMFFNVSSQIFDIFLRDKEAIDSLVQHPPLHRQAMEPDYLNNRRIVIKISEHTYSPSLEEEIGFFARTNQFSLKI